MGELCWVRRIEFVTVYGDSGFTAKGDEYYLEIDMEI